MGWMEQAADRSDEPKDLEQPDDDPDDDDDAYDLLNGAIHGDQIDQIQQQADDNERNNDADESRRKHVLLLHPLDAGKASILSGLRGKISRPAAPCELY